MNTPQFPLQFVELSARPGLCFSFPLPTTVVDRNGVIIFVDYWFHKDEPAITYAVWAQLEDMPFRGMIISGQVAALSLSDTFTADEETATMNRIVGDITARKDFFSQVRQYVNIFDMFDNKHEDPNCL